MIITNHKSIYGVTANIALLCFGRVAAASNDDDIVVRRPLASSSSDGVNRRVYRVEPGPNSAKGIRKHPDPESSDTDSAKAFRALLPDLPDYSNLPQTPGLPPPRPPFGPYPAKGNTSTPVPDSKTDDAHSLEKVLREIRRNAVKEPTKVGEPARYRVLPNMDDWPPRPSPSRRSITKRTGRRARKTKPKNKNKKPSASKRKKSRDADAWQRATVERKSFEACQKSAFARARRMRKQQPKRKVPLGPVIRKMWDSHTSNAGRWLVGKNKALYEGRLRVPEVSKLVRAKARVTMEARLDKKYKGQVLEDAKFELEKNIKKVPSLEDAKRLLKENDLA